MTRDHRRDLEALGGSVIVSWYCKDCGRSIVIEDERTFEEDWLAHEERHRRTPPREGIESMDADER